MSQVPNEQRVRKFWISLHRTSFLSSASRLRLDLPTTTDGHLNRSRRTMQPTALRTVSLAFARTPRALPLRATPIPLPFSPVAPRTIRAPRPRPFSSSRRAPNANSSSSTSSGSSAPPPQGAYAKFRALTKKYGWYAAGMYTVLSAIDFSICFLGVHAAGLERIEPYWRSAVRQFRVIRHGEEEADKLQREDERLQAEAKEQEKRDKEAGVVKKDSSKWGSKALWAEIALAYAIHKTALLPVRAGITVAVTPKFVNWLAARGWVGKVCPC